MTHIGRRRKRRRHRSSVQTAIWLIGIGILALTDWWWPGILFLIGISMLISASLPPVGGSDIQGTPPRTTPTKDPPPRSPVVKKPLEPPLPVKQPEAPIRIRADWLPPRCPACGAPLSTDSVHWHGSESAGCPYCDTVLEAP